MHITERQKWFKTQGSSRITSYNVCYTKLLRFTLDTSAESTPPAQAETEQAENEQIVDYTGLSLNQIAGAYTVNKVGTDEYYQFEIIENNGGFIVRHANGNESENDSRVFFLLMTKCDTVSDILGVNKGSFVVINGGHRFEK